MFRVRVKIGLVVRYFVLAEIFRYFVFSVVLHRKIHNSSAVCIFLVAVVLHRKIHNSSAVCIFFVFPHRSS